MVQQWPPTFRQNFISRNLQPLLVNLVLSLENGIPQIKYQFIKHRQTSFPYEGHRILCPVRPDDNPFTNRMIFNVVSTLGFLEIGVLISGVLFGIFTMQVYIYHKNFPKDSSWLKFGLVDGMWLFELGHTICQFYTLYSATVSRYGDPTVFLVFLPEVAAVPIYDGLIATLAQGFFTHRITKFAGPPYIIPIICSILMVCQMVASIGLTIAATVIAEKNIEQFLYQFKWLIVTATVFHVSIDVIVSTALVYYLLKNRSNTYRSTLVMIDKLIQWAIETGIVTRHILIDVNNSKASLGKIHIYAIVFSNAMLANLNSRMRFRDIQTTMVAEMVTITSPSTTAQLEGNLENSQVLSSAPIELLAEEGRQSEFKVLGLTAV
ncbi:uncharacterized protein C8R40DRAFT_1070355 [Lentinula edodes]|uniref:uncharacterized protein n=1 Tax=Lentinula edodes TaxID=5353 RepID=UPI001E8D8464|nr:uncharacterized protein C8R40DRAFT_1070355 [Lentinula edodes]KAH7874207.1 hypothetical protein C8R40DRAFT_1070355 [Lentinula edodes]